MKKTPAVFTPNNITVVRLLIALIAPFLLFRFNSFWGDILVFILLTIACVSDWWDGYLARKQSLVTATGKIIDPVADKLLILGLMFSFVLMSLYSFEWIACILVREIMVTSTRLVRLRRAQVIPAEWAGKVKLVVQTGSVYLTLFYLMVLHRGSLEETSQLLLVMKWIHYFGIAAANFFTISSGIHFFKHLSRL